MCFTQTQSFCGWSTSRPLNHPRCVQWFNESGSSSSWPVSQSQRAPLWCLHLCRTVACKNLSPCWMHWNKQYKKDGGFFGGSLCLSPAWPPLCVDVSASCCCTCVEAWHSRSTTLQDRLVSLQSNGYSFYDWNVTVDTRFNGAGPCYITQFKKKTALFRHSSVNSLNPSCFLIFFFYNLWQLIQPNMSFGATMQFRK